MKAIGVLLVVPILLLAACANVTPVPASHPTDPATIDSPTRARMRELRDEITSIIGDRHCESTADCRALGLDAKPCGGPWGYLVYSTRNVDVSLLQLKVEEYNRLARQRNIEEGLGSDCKNVPGLVPECRNNTCIGSPPPDPYPDEWSSPVPLPYPGVP